MIILAIILVIILILGFGLICLSHNQLAVDSAFYLIMIFIIVLTLLSHILFSEGKKQGQIEVLSGSNIRYELKENPDKTKEWVEIESKNK